MDLTGCVSFSGCECRQGVHALGEGAGVSDEAAAEFCARLLRSARQARGAGRGQAHAGLI